MPINVRWEVTVEPARTTTGRAVSEPAPQLVPITAIRTLTLPPFTGGAGVVVSAQPPWDSELLTLVVHGRTWTIRSGESLRVRPDGTVFIDRSGP